LSGLSFICGPTGLAELELAELELAEFEFVEFGSSFLRLG
jgi:hypothetical protein